MYLSFVVTVKSQIFIFDKNSMCVVFSIENKGTTLHIWVPGFDTCLWILTLPFY